MEICAAVEKIGNSADTFTNEIADAIAKGGNPGEMLKVVMQGSLNLGTMGSAVNQVSKMSNKISQVGN